jgi:hypothetical protein
MSQLVKVSNSTDLYGNPWVCDCPLFNTTYSWCQNNSVDLELVCSNPPKFKGKTWKFYEYSGCDNDNTDFAYLVEDIVTLNDTLPHEPVDKYIDQSVPHFFPRPEHEQLVRTNESSFYIFIALLVLFLGLLAAAVIVWWYGVRPLRLRRSGPVHSDAETHPLSSNTGKNFVSTV